MEDGDLQNDVISPEIDDKRTGIVGGVGSSWDALYSHIKQLGIVEGSKKNYTPDQLIDIINEVRNGKKDITYITKEKDVRYKVIALMERDKMAADFQEDVYSKFLQEARSPLEKYILEGLWMAGHGIDVSDYFADEKISSALKVGYSPGELVHVNKLRSHKDLELTLTDIAVHTRRFQGGGLEIASAGFSGNPLEHPDQYRPDLLARFRFEVGIIAAEEWLHELRHQLGVNLAGQSDSEADIAMYYHKLGLPLSAHFLSRYPEREKLFEKKEVV